MTVLAENFKKAATGKLVVFRHGETEYNQLHFMTGQRDIPLTPVGEEQARQAGRALAGLRFDVAYSSTLQRSFKTACHALAESGSNDHLRTNDGVWRVVKSAAIAESDTGDFTGRNYKTDPEILAFKAGKLAYDVKLPNGESDKDVTDRVRAFFNDEVAPRLARGETVMMSVHAGVVLALDIVQGLEAEPAPGEKLKRKSLPNAAPVVYEYENSKLSCFYPLGGDAVAPSAPVVKSAPASRPSAP